MAYFKYRISFNAVKLLLYPENSMKSRKMVDFLKKKKTANIECCYLQRITKAATKLDVEKSVDVGRAQMKALHRGTKSTCTGPLSI